MGWFNYYGLAVMAIIMIPNIVYFAKRKSYDPAYNSKAVVLAEQIGRYGCFAFMICNVPYTYFNFWFDYALIVYLSVNGALCLAYLVFWAVYRNADCMPKAIALSVIPSCVFLFGGVVLLSIPLIVFSVLFAASHIFISVKSVTPNA